MDLNPINYYNPIFAPPTKILYPPMTVLVLCWHPIFRYQCLLLALTAGASLSKTEEREGCHNSTVRPQLSMFDHVQFLISSMISVTICCGALDVSRNIRALSFSPNNKTLDDAQSFIL
jgi:hypothetical protein